MDGGTFCATVPGLQGRYRHGTDAGGVSYQLAEVGEE
jgi:hypothetical protein